MKTFFVIILAAALAAPMATSVGAEGSLVGTERYIVAFFAQPTQEPGDEYAGGTVVQNIQGLRMLVVETESAALFESRVMLDDGVRYLERDDPNAAFLLLVPNDSLYSNAGHYGSKKIGAEAAWDRTTGTTSVKVAMIDSGLNKAHEEFSGQSRVLAGWDYYNGDSDPDDTSGCSFHGTHTTGTAGATINNAKGIAGMSQHTILPFKAFQNGGLGCGGSTTALVNALKAAGDSGAHVSSNSWGSSASSSAFNDAITYSHNLGVIHVAAAGNSGPCTNCVGFPWRDMGSVVIVVSSTTSTDTQSSFSSEGAQVDVGAPGSSILSSTSGTTGYGTLSGTSMATPHVAGTVALLKALQPSYTFADVESRLCTTAVDLGAAGEDDDFGCGRVNADAATNLGPPPTTQCNDGVDNDGDTLIDYPNDPGCSSASDDDETDAPPPSITLSVTGYKVKGRKYGDLVWSGATGASVDVYRQGAVVATTANDGAYTDATGLNGGGTLTWKVCEAGTSVCSNDASWTY